MNHEQTASIIMAAGRGSRMKGYSGSKTLLPLIPQVSMYDGVRPILRHILDQLPPGPKAVIVNHCKNDVMAVTQLPVENYYEQPVLNGTGGALLAARSFIEQTEARYVLVTMGDVPLVAPQTYNGLVASLAKQPMTVLGFTPAEKKQYGLLEIEDGSVIRITEWKTWKDYPRERQAALNVCNAGIYAFECSLLAQYLDRLARTPHQVEKMVDGQRRVIDEYFITDLVSYLATDGHSVGYRMVADPDETLGVDDPDALRRAQQLYARYPLGGKP